jgi:hypothetical protein
MVDNGRYRVVLGAASAVPVLSEAVLPRSAGIDEVKAFAVLCASVPADAELSDELAGPGYRRRVAHSIVLRALEQCGAPR